VRLILDEMLSHRIAQQLQSRGFDIEAITDHPELRSLHDEPLLRTLREAGQAIVTDNVADFTRLHAQFLAQALPHAGIVCCTIPRSMATIGRWVDALDAFLAAAEPDVTLAQRCVWLS